MKFLLNVPSTETKIIIPIMVIIQTNSHLINLIINLSLRFLSASFPLVFPSNFFSILRALITLTIHIGAHINHHNNIMHDTMRIITHMIVFNVSENHKFNKNSSMYDKSNIIIIHKGRSDIRIQPIFSFFK